MLCVFCDNDADDRPGAPLCIECWDRIDEQVRTRKPEPLVVDVFGAPDTATMMRTVLAGGRAGAIASFNGLVGRLVGPPPGTKLN
jgi:hypothetical protein